MERRWFEGSLRKPEFQIYSEFLIFALALSLVLGLRLLNLHYNSLFLDEAIYAVVGEDVLAGSFVRGGTRFMLGSYIYPATSAMLSDLGGVTALRLGSVLFTSAAAVFIYLATRALFGRWAALLGMLLFGLTGASISLGQLAVYDALALPLLALSLLLMLRAGLSEERIWLKMLASSLAIVGAVLVKYISLLYLPAVMMAGFFILLAEGRGVRPAIRPLLLFWLLPTIIALSGYGAYYYSDLMQAVANQGFASASSSAIISTTLHEIGPTILMATLGWFLLLLCLWRNNACAPAFLLQLFEQQRGNRKRLFWLAATGAAVLLLLLSLAGPLYHLLAQNIRSLWKTTLFSLVFLAPMAAYFLAVLLKWAGNLRRPVVRVVILVAMFVLLLSFVRSALERQRAHQNSWPNTAGVVAYLRQAGLSESSRVLAEAMDIYEYYFDFGTDDRLIWSSIWYAYYQPEAARNQAVVTIKGPEAVELGIRSGYYDFVIVDDYYAPGTRLTLGPSLAEAGYQITYSEEQEFPGGHKLLLQVYEPQR